LFVSVCKKCERCIYLPGRGLFVALLFFDRRGELRRGLAQQLRHSAVAQPALADEARDADAGREEELRGFSLGSESESE